MSASPVILPFRSRHSRRDDVMHCLAEVGRGDPTSPYEDEWAARLRLALERLGPVFVSFGTYLGTRIDLLPTADCEELRQAFRASRPLSSAALRRLLSQEGTASSHSVDVDEGVESVGPLSEIHRGRLRDNTVVRVEILHVTHAELSEDLELLQLVRPTFEARLPDAVLAAALDDFRVRLRVRCDFREKLAIVAEGAGCVGIGEAAIVPHPIPALCTERILVTQLPDPEDPPSAIGHEAGSAWAERSNLAHAAVSAWLRETLFGSICPVAEPFERIEMSGGRLVAYGIPARLLATTQESVLTQLLAVDADLPDRAWSALRTQLIPCPGAAPEDEVRRGFRCLVPFRDDPTGDSGSAVADHIFLQWRYATRHGWVPAVHLVPVYQGFLGVVLAAREHQSDEDVVAAALRAIRFTAGFRQLEAWASRMDLMTEVERQMLHLIEMPQRIDRLLTIAADGNVRVEISPGDRTAGRRKSAAVLAIVLLVVAALSLIAQWWPLKQEASFVPPLGPVVFVAAGALLVWAVESLT